MLVIIIIIIGKPKGEISGCTRNDTSSSSFVTPFGSVWRHGSGTKAAGPAAAAGPSFVGGNGFAFRRIRSGIAI